MPDTQKRVKSIGSNDAGRAAELGENRVVALRARHVDRSPVAERIRDRIAALGKTESEVSESLGNDRRILSATLRKLDRGANLRSDTVQRLAVVLGVTEQWILTGEPTETVPRLDADPLWAAASAEARDAYGLEPAWIAQFGAYRLPAPPELNGATLLVFSRIYGRAS